VPLGGGVGGLGALTINVKNVDGGSPGAVPEVRQRPPSTQKTLTACLVGGGAGGLGASTTQLEDVDALLPVGGPISIHDLQMCRDLHGQDR
jgi:hypothetical protein